MFPRVNLPDQFSWQSSSDLFKKQISIWLILNDSHEWLLFVIRFVLGFLFTRRRSNSIFAFTGTPVGRGGRVSGWKLALVMCAVELIWVPFFSLSRPVDISALKWIYSHILLWYLVFIVTQLIASAAGRPLTEVLRVCCTLALLSPCPRVK